MNITTVFTDLLPNNRRLFWFHYFGSGAAGRRSWALARGALAEQYSLKPAVRIICP
jgi:hypothetical protein